MELDHAVARERPVILTSAVAPETNVDCFRAFLATGKNHTTPTLKRSYLFLG